MVGRSGEEEGGKKWEGGGCEGTREGDGRTMEGIGRW